MKHLSIDPDPANAARDVPPLERARDWPAKALNPYSPLLCVSLLLAVGLIIKLAKSPLVLSSLAY